MMYTSIFVKFKNNKIFNESQDAFGAASSAIGIARASSTRTSRRSRKSISEGSPTAAPYLEEIPAVDGIRVMKMNLPEWPYILLGLHNL